MIYMFTKKVKTAVACLAGAVMILSCASAMAEGISAQQGDAILSELRQIRILLEKQRKEASAPEAPAQPERVRLKVSSKNAMGQKSAPVVMVEFTDYQCPFCNRFYTGTFPQLKKDYIDTGKLLFIPGDYPLDFHPFAMKAALATNCASDQGKFWQMKDALMLNFNRLSNDVITTFGQDAGLEMDRFLSCIDSDKYQSAIKEDIAAANGIGINGTPAFVVGKMKGQYLEGYKIVGAQPFSEFKKLIQEIETGKQ